MNFFDVDAVLRSLPFLWHGLQFTLSLTVVAAVLGIILGSLLAIARLSSWKVLSVGAKLYVNLMRSTPLVLVIFWVFFLSPLILQAISGDARPPAVGANLTAYITFTLFEAAYFSEIIRAGIQSIPRGQIYAGQAIGLTFFQSMRHIILPQAMRKTSPVLLTQIINLFQDTSLVYVISVTDFLGAASKVAERDSTSTTMYIFVAAVYFIICFMLSSVVKRIHLKHATF